MGNVVPMVQPNDLGSMRTRRAQRELLKLMEHPRVGKPRAAHDLKCGEDNSMNCTCGAEDLNRQIQRCLLELSRPGA